MNYPLNLTFKITTISNDFNIIDANGEIQMYTRQKLLKLKEQIEIFRNESRTELLYKIHANKWLDFSASYQFLDSGDRQLGRVVRRGWKSIWKAHYEIYNENDMQEFFISEENPWIKVWDSLVGEIPILNVFTGYFLNPSYSVTRTDGTQVARLRKEKSFFGRRFTVNKLADFNSKEENRILLGLMMMILLERRRG